MVFRNEFIIVKTHDFVFPQRLRFKSPHGIMLWWNRVGMYDLWILCSFCNSWWGI